MPFLTHEWMAKGCGVGTCTCTNVRKYRGVYVSVTWFFYHINYHDIYMEDCFDWHHKIWYPATIYTAIYTARPVCWSVLFDLFVFRHWFMVAGLLDLVFVRLLLILISDLVITNEEPVIYTISCMSIPVRTIKGKNKNYNTGITHTTLSININNVCFKYCYTNDSYILGQIGYTR